MRSFVRWHGQVPQDATRLDDAAARDHPAPWIRQFVLDGIGASYVIAYGLGECWWTFLFERDTRSAPQGADCWCVEGYTHDGKAWKESFFHWDDEDRWHPA